MVGYLMNNFMERILKEVLYPKRDTDPEFARQDGGKPWKISIRIAGVSVEIRTENLPNTRLEPWLLDQPATGETSVNI